MKAKVISRNSVHNGEIVDVLEEDVVYGCLGERRTAVKTPKYGTIIYLKPESIEYILSEEDGPEVFKSNLREPESVRINAREKNFYIIEREYLDEAMTLKEAEAEILNYGADDYCIISEIEFTESKMHVELKRKFGVVIE